MASKFDELPLFDRVPMKEEQGITISNENALPPANVRLSDYHFVRYQFDPFEDPSEDEDLDGARGSANDDVEDNAKKRNFGSAILEESSSEKQPRTSRLDVSRSSPATTLADPSATPKSTRPFYPPTDVLPRPDANSSLDVQVHGPEAGELNSRPLETTADRTHPSHQPSTIAMGFEANDDFEVSDSDSKLTFSDDARPTLWKLKDGSTRDDDTTEDEEYAQGMKIRAQVMEEDAQNMKADVQNLKTKMDTMTDALQTLADASASATNVDVDIASMQLKACEQTIRVVHTWYKNAINETRSRYRATRPSLREQQESLKERMVFLEEQREGALGHLVPWPKFKS
ncbi:MAG: hypothetical protein L6R40_001058 [Gallowayella cf. fulva]|nr:MAG: hypothetical protein L6R40_001058 [Xanthomendoza cf. fulva]